MYTFGSEGTRAEIHKRKHCIIVPGLVTRICIFALFSSYAHAATNVWRERYISDFGQILPDPNMRTPTGKIVKYWVEPNVFNQTMFSKPLEVWSNGYVSTTNRSPVEYQVNLTGSSVLGWKALYRQQSVLRNLTLQLQNITDTSESDYPFQQFATFPPATQVTGNVITAQEFGHLMGITAKVVRWHINCSPDGCDSIFKAALDYLGKHTKNVQQFSVDYGWWVKYPTFVVGQRSDGTLLGVCSTEIAT